MSNAKRIPKPKKNKRQEAANDRSLRELALFAQENVGFRLGLAYFESVETRREQLERLKEMLADKPVDLTIINLGDFPGEQSLLHRLEAHLAEHPAPEGKSSAVMVIGLEALLDYREVHEYHPAPQMILRNANWHRELFLERAPCPVVLWLLPTASRIFALEAPDLWHWRSGIFHFQGKPGGREEVEREILAMPILRSESLPREEKSERITLLNDLLSELQNADDFETKGNKARRANLLQELGVAYVSLSEAQRAKSYFEDALELYREVGDRLNQGIALRRLGIVNIDLGELESAKTFLGEARTIAIEIGDRRSESAALINQGVVYKKLGELTKDLGDFEKARALFEQSLAIDQEIGDRRGEGLNLGNLGSVYQSLGQSEKAISFYENALAIHRETGNRRGEAGVLFNLGHVRSAHGEFEKAIGFYEQALTIYQEIGERTGIGYALGHLGVAYKNLGDLQRAIALYNEAIEEFRKANDQRSEGIFLGSLGNAESLLGNYEQAIESTEKAVAILGKVGDLHNKRAFLNNLRIFYSQRGQIDGLRTP